MKHIMVIGVGTMGVGIAQVFAQSGHKTYLVDREFSLVQQGLAKIEKNLSRQMEKGKLQEEQKSAALSNLIATENPEKTSVKIDLFLEAIPEDLELKRMLFRELNRWPKNENSIVASNTSALSISELANEIKNPGRFIGIHFFNPAPVMSLVEIIRGVLTEEQVVEETQKLIKSLGKTPIVVRESPGFVVNRLLVPMINEAVFLLMEGVASAEDIDKAMKLGANHPMGPLALADFIGLDVCLSAMEALQKETGDDKFRPCPLLRKMVRAGFLGLKTGRGFYSYER